MDKPIYQCIMYQPQDSGRKRNGELARGCYGTPCLPLAEALRLYLHRSPWKPAPPPVEFIYYESQELPVYLDTIVFLIVYIRTQLYLLLATTRRLFLFAHTRDFVVHSSTNEPARMCTQPTPSRRHSLQRAPPTTPTVQFMSC